MTTTHVRAPEEGWQYKTRCGHEIRDPGWSASGARSVSVEQIVTSDPSCRACIRATRANAWREVEPAPSAEGREDTKR